MAADYSRSLEHRMTDSLIALMGVANHYRKAGAVHYADGMEHAVRALEGELSRYEQEVDTS